MAVTEQDRTCPACDTAALGEWDEVLRRFHCPTCSTPWRRRPGRLVPRYTPRLPYTAGPMTFDTELPDPSSRGGSLPATLREKVVHRVEVEGVSLASVTRPFSSWKTRQFSISRDLPFRVPVP